MTIRGFADFATQFLLFQAFPNAMRRLFAKTGSIGEMGMFRQLLADKTRVILPQLN